MPVEAEEESGLPGAETTIAEWRGIISSAEVGKEREIQEEKDKVTNGARRKRRKLDVGLKLINGEGKGTWD